MSDDNLINPWTGEPDLVRRQTLLKVAEEANELAKACTRAAMQGYDESEPVTGKPNALAIHEELVDLSAITEIYYENFPDARGLVYGLTSRYERKLRGFRRWWTLLRGQVNGPV